MIEWLRRRPYASLAKVWIPTLLLLLSAEFCFDRLFWNLPKLTPDTADHGYRFALDATRWQQRPDSDALSVLAIGSSVAGCFDADQVRRLLRASLEERVEVERLLLPGVHPAEYEMYFSQHQPRASLVFLLVNIVDFIYSNVDREMNPTLSYIIPPAVSLRERASSTAFVSKVDLLLASGSDLYRYRKLLRSAVRDNIAAGWQLLQPHPQEGAYGVYPDLHTEQHFGIDVGTRRNLDLEYRISEEWIEQWGSVNLRFRKGGEELLLLKEREPGWRNLPLDFPEAGHVLHVAADSSWVPRASDSGNDTRSLSLQLRPSSEFSYEGSGVLPLEYSPGPWRQRKPLLRMGGAVGSDFDRKWQEMIDSDSRFGHRLRLYESDILAIRGRPFNVDPEFSALRELVENLVSSGSKVVVVNTPESPKLLDRIRDSEYYQAYLNFLRVLANHSAIQFHDLSSALPKEEFNDWHHVTQVGTLVLGRRFADIARETALSQVKGEGR